jgi:hypothetical protein
MYAEPVSVQRLFSADRRQYRVPFFQRPYVWDRENQWERLWDDISGKADAGTEGDSAPPHFLGAIVLEPQKKEGLFGVEMVNIIDGQRSPQTEEPLPSGLSNLDVDHIMPMSWRAYWRLLMARSPKNRKLAVSGSHSCPAKSRTSRYRDQTPGRREEDHRQSVARSLWREPQLSEQGIRGEAGKAIRGFEPASQSHADATRHVGRGFDRGTRRVARQSGTEDLASPKVT